MIPNPWIIAGFLAALIVAGWKGYDLGYDAADAKHVAANAKADKEAQAAAEKSRAEAKAIEDALRAEKDRIEKENADALAKINGLRIANGRLVAAHGGLYDRNGRPVASGGNGLPSDSNATGSVANGATGCRLSDKVADDLLSLAYDADRAATYAHTCRAWVLSVGQ